MPYHLHAQSYFHDMMSIYMTLVLKGLVRFGHQPRLRPIMTGFTRDGFVFNASLAVCSSSKRLATAFSCSSGDKDPEPQEPGDARIAGKRGLVFGR